MPRCKPDKLSKRAQILIPELLNRVLLYLDRSDYTKLVSISRHWFYCVASLLWRHVTGLSRLFSLVPNLKTTLKRKPGADVSERIVVRTQCIVGN
ncbi:hypothetical protein B0J17DRAFT_670107 [Rhizoctonia solani]|nr:hypothetical protein B0J17DRAFT_670107 [Rhizoctonia solani]